ncbi:MAG: amidohydrolase family protein [Gemmatimonadaceae bacterium]
MATSNAASFLGATREWGTIERGKRGDLVLLATNPLEDIRNTTRIVATVVGGRVIARPALDAVLERAKREINPPSHSNSLPY